MCKCGRKLCILKLKGIGLFCFCFYLFHFIRAKLTKNKQSKKENDPHCVGRNGRNRSQEKHRPYPYCPLTGYHFQQSNVLGREKGKISNYYMNSLVHLRPSYVHKCYTIHTLIILFLTQRNICST